MLFRAIRSRAAIRRAVARAGGQSELSRRSNGAFSQQNLSYWVRHGVPRGKARAVWLAAGKRVSLRSLLGSS